MPAGVAALERLGLNGEKGAPFNGVRYHVGERIAEGRHSHSDTGAALVHFELADSLIYMQASVNGSRPLWMMLDTGASVTVFDESVSKMLGIRFRGEEMLMDARVCAKAGIRQPRYPHVCGERAGRSNRADAASRMVLARGGPKY